MFGFGKSKSSANEMSAEAKRIIELLDCPCEHFPKGTDANKVMNAYNEAFVKGDAESFTPVIITADALIVEELEEYAKTAEELKVNHDRLMNAPRFDVQKWFTDILADCKEAWGDDWNDCFGEYECNKSDAVNSFTGFRQYDNKGKSEECILAKIPTDEPWEVFAWLPFGGWNECPNPEEIVRVAEYFYNRYKAIPAVMTHDVLEFSAVRLKDKDSAIGAALEHYAFCQDIVDQGIGTIGRLAGSLTLSGVWYFWWD